MNYIKSIPSKDGTLLYTKVNENEKSKGNIIIVHGLAEHLDRYDELADFLSREGFNVIRYDQRGHGRSEGKATFYSRVDEIVEDLESVVEYTKKNYSGKNYLIGHSMGGYTVVLFATKKPNSVDGVITSGALTRYNNKIFGCPDRKSPPDAYIKNQLGGGVCSDKNIVKKYENDDLVSNKISMGLIYTLLDGVEYLKSNSKFFIDKVLLLHGADDGIVSHKDSLELYSEIGSMHKSIHIYDNLQHEIFNESSYNQNIFREIKEWIDSDIKQ